MYLNDKKVRFNVRVSESMAEYIYSRADSLEVSPSEFIRMLIRSAIATEKKAKGGEVRENGKTSINSKL